MTEQSKETVKIIYNLKNEILKSKDKAEIAELLQKVITIATNAPEKTSGRISYSDYYKISREKSLDILIRDLKLLKDGSYFDLELIHFQIACSILSFLLTMTNGVSDVDKIINGLDL
ncbi:MAG: hypothetical protein MH132_02220 [Hydrotalea sp.]|nr:hypothetical protein [Hydrotalea sp.]